MEDRNRVATLPGMTIGSPPPPPDRSAPWRRRLGRAGITLGVILTGLALLCCTGGAYIAYDASRAPREQRAMEALATTLCRALIAGDAEAVYAAMSADARDRYSPREFADDLAARGRIPRCEV